MVGVGTAFLEWLGLILLATTFNNASMPDVEAAPSSDSPSVPPAQSTSGSTSRKALLGALDVDDKSFAGERRKALVTGAPGARSHAGNVRKSTHAGRLFGWLLVLTLVLVGGVVFAGFYAYKTLIEPRLGIAVTRPAVPIATPVRLEVPPETLRTLDDLGSKIGDLQKQIDALREQQTKVQSEMEGMVEKVTAVISTERKPDALSAVDSPLPERLRGATDESAELLTAADTPAVHELRLLKDRNRLSGWADEAIATGSRDALQRIVDSLDDPAMATLKHAAQAEYFRVYTHYQGTNRIEPEYKLPLADLFKKEQGIRDEADLSTKQVAELMFDTSKDWRVRLRSAWLMGGRRSFEVGEMLIKVIKDDPSLDVAKEAQLSFEQNTEHTFRLFDIPAIDAWWKTQTSLRTEPVPRAELRAQQAKGAKSK